MQLGTVRKKTGLHYDRRLETSGTHIKYLKRNSKLSFAAEQGRQTHKLLVGDNYDSLLNLRITHTGQIDIIYIDPPYGKDAMGAFAKTNYQNGISRDNLLSMLYPRLMLARELMSEHAVIYCSIDDRNQAYLKCLFDDVFGENNFIGLITQNKGNAQNDAINMQKNSDYILVYCKNRKFATVNGKQKEVPLLREGTLIKKEVFEDQNGRYYYKGSGLLTGSNPTLKDRHNLGWSIYYHPDTKDCFALMDYDVELAKTEVYDEDAVYTTDQSYIDKGYIVIRPPRRNGKLGRWTWKADRFNAEKDNILITDNLSVVQKVYVTLDETTVINGKRYFIKDSLTKNTKSVWDEFSSAAGTTHLTEIIPEKGFDNPKNVFMIQKLIEIYREKENPIVLDFFAGSGTTGQAVLLANRADEGSRQFILCTANEKTNENPNGIVYDVTSKRLKRIMTGECYDGFSDFEWIKKNEKFGDGLEVFNVGGNEFDDGEDCASVSETETTPGKTAFDVIDETCYGLPKFENFQDKAEWICSKFEKLKNCLRGEQDE